MTKNRDRDEIIALILGACQEPITRSKIMYKSLLNFHQVNAYVDMLTEAALLNNDVLARTFVITNKGREYLELYNSGMQLVHGKNKDKVAQGGSMIKSDASLSSQVLPLTIDSKIDGSTDNDQHSKKYQQRATTIVDNKFTYSESS